jgi:hypothetical protein
MLERTTNLFATDTDRVTAVATAEPDQPESPPPVAAELPSDAAGGDGSTADMAGPDPTLSEPDATPGPGARARRRGRRPTLPAALVRAVRRSRRIVAFTLVGLLIGMGFATALHALVAHAPKQQGPAAVQRHGIARTHVARRPGRGGRRRGGQRTAPGSRKAKRRRRDFRPARPARRVPRRTQRALPSPPPAVTPVAPRPVAPSRPAAPSAPAASAGAAEFSIER